MWRGHWGTLAVLWHITFHLQITDHWGQDDDTYSGPLCVLCLKKAAATVWLCAFLLGWSARRHCKMYDSTSTRGTDLYFCNLRRGNIIHDTSSSPSLHSWVTQMIPFFQRWEVVQNNLCCSMWTVTDSDKLAPYYKLICNEHEHLCLFKVSVSKLESANQTFHHFSSQELILLNILTHQCVHSVRSKNHLKSCLSPPTQPVPVDQRFKAGAIKTKTQSRKTDHNSLWVLSIHATVFLLNVVV